MTELRYFDALMFLGKTPDAPTREHSTTNSLRQTLDRYGFDRGLVLPMTPGCSDPAYGNEQLFSAAQQDPRITPCPFAHIDFRKLGTQDDAYVKTLIDRGARAVCFYPKTFTRGMAPRVTGDLLTSLQKHQLPLVLFETGMAEAADIAEQYPSLPIILPQAEWKSNAMIRTLAATPNLHITLGLGFSLYRGIEAMIDLGCQRQILFGSGYPLSEPGAALCGLCYTSADESSLESIASGNLQRLVNSVHNDQNTKLTDTPDRVPAQPKSTSKLILAARTGKHLPLDNIIDMHAHLSSWLRMSFHGGRAEDMVQQMDQTGISKSFISHLACLTAEPKWGNDQVIDAIKRYPDRFSGYAVCWPIEEETGINEIRRCMDAGMRGIKIHNGHGISYTHEGYRPVWELADKYHLPVLLHTWGDMTDYESIFQRYPNAQVLLGHSGCANEELYVEFAHKYPNIYLELCHSFSRHGIVEYLVEQAGADRVLYGSDAAVHSYGQQLGRVIYADIKEEQKEKILSTTAVRLLDKTRAYQ